MKKTLKFIFVFFITIIAIGCIYAETFEKVELLDDFGDPTGVSYIQAKNDFDGTYKNTSGVSNGKLKWNIKLEDGKVIFVLKENGQVNQLSTAYYTSDTFEVKVKDNETGNTSTYSGAISMGEEGAYNCIVVQTSYGWFISNDLSSFLRGGNDCKIVISNARGSYSLGALNASEIEALLYDVDSYNEIMKNYEAGEYDIAIEMIDSLKLSDSTSYEFYGLQKIEAEASYQQIVSLYNDGKIEEMLDSIEAFKNEEFWDKYYSTYSLSLRNLEGDAKIQILDSLYNDGKYGEVLASIEGYWYESWSLAYESKLNKFENDTKIQILKSLLNDGKYEEVFANIEAYRDGDNWYYASKDFKSEIENIEYDTKIQQIVSLYNDGKIEEMLDSIEAFTDFYNTMNLPEELMDVYKKSGQYLVGFEGPAGGYIFYDVDADNDYGNEDGLISSECGWRYMEAAPADLRVVNGVPTIDSSVEGYYYAPDTYVFGYYKTGANENSLFIDGTSTTLSSGKGNTEKLVSVMGVSAYAYSSATDQYAAKLCDDLEYNGFDDWFLPSKDELNLMYNNLARKNIGSFSSYYWSSSEMSANGAYCKDLEWGSDSIGFRNDDHYIRPCRAF